MKVLLLLLLLVMAMVSPAWAVTLTWDANGEPDLAGYKVYYDVNTGAPYSGKVTMPLADLSDADNPEFSITLPEGVFYYFVVTAYDTENLESGFSNEVMCADGVKPGTVINININCGHGQ